MPYLIIAGLALFLLVTYAGCGKPKTPNTASPPEPKPAPAVERVAAPAKVAPKPSDPEALTETPKKKVPRNACCYKMSAPPTTFDYLCPRCGERTLYALPPNASEKERAAVVDATFVLNVQLEGCRRALAAIRDLPVELDESQFCRKCSPAVEKPELVLVVRRPGAAGPHRVAGVTVEDLRLLNEYLSGKPTHTVEHDYETPMARQAQRLEELLGLKPSLSEETK